MQICLKCGSYYADATPAFCLSDGAPLVNVEPGSNQWSEGTRAIEEKAKGLRKQQRKQRWRRVLRVATTMLVTTMVVVVVAVNALIRLNVLPVGSTPSPAPASVSLLSPSPLPSPSAGEILLVPPCTRQSPCTSPSPSPSPSASPAVSASPTPTPVRVFKISGRVSNPTGNVGGITIRLEGSKNSSMITDGNGFYTFSDLPAGGSYTVTPGKAHMSFTPANRAVGNLLRDESVNFASLELFTISGRVTAQGRPFAGVNIRLDGASTESATTDANGFYSFTDLPARARYTVSPTKTKVDFTPINRSFSNLARDESADFVAVAQREVFKISGRVTNQGRPVEGVNIVIRGTRLQAAAKTDGNGFYSFGDLPAGGGYIVSPGRTRLNFTPLNRPFNNLTRDETANFDAVGPPDIPPARLYKISGRVVFPGGVVRDIAIRLTGSTNGRTTTNPEGFYSFNNLPAGGNYTVTPESAAASFRPGSRSFNNLARDEGADFERVAPRGTTQTSAPAPVCTDDDRNSVVRVIKAKFPGVELLKSRIETCTATFIMIVCEWGVRNQRLPERFKCEKSAREWQCR